MPSHDDVAFLADGLPQNLAAEREDCWKVEQGKLVARYDQAWTHLETEKKLPARVGGRARIRLVKGDAIKLRINGQCERVLANRSSFL